MNAVGACRNTSADAATRAMCCESCGLASSSAMASDEPSCATEPEAMCVKSIALNSPTYLVFMTL